MGQAKIRGTFEERRDKAIEKGRIKLNKQTLSLDIETFLLNKVGVVGAGLSPISQKIIIKELLKNHEVIIVGDD